MIDAGVSTAIYGPMSNLSKVRRIIDTARQLSITPQCLGTSMMKAMVLGVNSSAITETFYQAATEIGPLTGLTRFATRNPVAKESYIFHNSTPSSPLDLEPQMTATKEPST